MQTILTHLELGEVQYLRMLPQLNICCTLNFHKVGIREAVSWIFSCLVTKSNIFLMVYAWDFWCSEHCYATCAVFSKHSGCTKYHSCSNSEEVSVYSYTSAFLVKWFCRSMKVAAMLKTFLLFLGLTWSKGYMSSIYPLWPLAYVLQQQMSWLRFKLWRLITLFSPIWIRGLVPDMSSFIAS